MMLGSGIIAMSGLRKERKYIMKQVTVIHTAFDENPTVVALVNVPEEFDTIDALEYAYRRTNNIEGSWSKGEFIEFNGDTFINGDYSENVTVMAPLPINNGVEYGLRSTSVGDEMIFEGKKFKVSSFGFKPAL